MLGGTKSPAVNFESDFQDSCPASFELLDFLLLILLFMDVSYLFPSRTSSENYNLPLHCFESVE
jgi:hypothetical protein